MRSAVSLGAALVSAALAVSMPWSAVAADAPLDGALAGGGRYIVRPLGGAPVAAIALWYRAPDAGFDATPWPGLGRLAATAVAASQPVTGTPLGAYIERLGGRITISAYPDSVEIALLVPADRATSAVQALTRSFFAPVLTDAGLDDARRTVAEEAALRGLNPSAAISDRLYGALFTAGPDAAAPFPVPTAVAAIGTATVRSYAERAFRPSNAILVASGAVTAAVMSGALRGREDAAPGTEPAVPNAVATPAPVHASAPVEGFGLAWAGPPISDEAAGTIA